MAKATAGSMLLASTDPAKLRDFYAAAFELDVSTTPDGGYDVVPLGSFALMIDTRDDVGQVNPEPGRMILNVEVDDARTAAGRIEAAGGTWLARLEDRDGSLFATAIDPDGNYVQIIQLSDQHRAAME